MPMMRPNVGDDPNNKKIHEADVFIAGCGPIGATYAKILVEAGFKVVVADIGASDSFRTAKDSKGNEIWIPGAHKKNEIEYQKDIDRFVNVIKGALSPVSVPVEAFTTDTIDPIVHGADGTKPPVTNGKNPMQKWNINLSAEAVTRGVGGMTTHWTCATPRFHAHKDSGGKYMEGVEQPLLVENRKGNIAEWDRLYSEAEKLIGTTTKAFDESFRHTLILETLKAEYNKKRTFESLPLACHRMPNPDYVYWHATDTILQDIYCNPAKKELFTLLTNHCCSHLKTNDLDAETKIDHVLLKNLLSSARGEESLSVVKADIFIVASGAVATPQILFNSNFDPPIQNLGKYITEQPMTFCQVVIKRDLMRKLSNEKCPYSAPDGKYSWWGPKIKKHHASHPEDPLGFPFRDPEPQVTTLFSADNPWHTQIHRDAFSYGAVASTIDSRTVVDLRFFGYTEPCETNTLTFEEKIKDGYDMPQPTFNFQLGDSDRERAHRMMIDMCEIASKLGGFLPGSEPQFMAPGLALHLGGTVRAGLDPKKHVADTYCKVYDFDNLYVGGNGVIPTGFASNPTLTSMGYAIRSAESIIKKLGGPKVVAHN